MRTGVVFADVFADDAAAEGTLTFVAVVLFLDDFFAVKERVNYLNAKEIHQNFVIFRNANHQIVVDTFVMLDAVLRNVNFFAAGGKLEVPFFVEF